MSVERSGGGGGIGLFGVLGIVFIVLKLTDVIDWSWWLVLLPFYLWIPVVASIFCLAGLLSGIGKVLEKSERGKFK